jgi:hypothetical protein
MVARDPHLVRKAEAIRRRKGPKQRAFADDALNLFFAEDCAHHRPPATQSSHQADHGAPPPSPRGNEHQAEECEDGRRREDTRASE